MNRNCRLQLSDIARFALSAGALFLVIAVPAAVHAQGTYAERAIRRVIPFAPGGNIGAAEVAHACADGYTLLIGTSSTHAISSFQKNLDSLGMEPVNDPAGENAA